MPPHDEPGSMTTALIPEALDWLDRIRAADACVEDQAALAKWRARSPAHDAAFREIVALRHRARALAALRPHVAAQGRQRKAPLIGRRSLIAGAGTAIAASVAGGLLYPPLGLWPSLADLLADHHTGPGQQLAFSPAKGIRVEMNSRTSLSALGNGGLQLAEGEAYFTVRGLERSVFTVSSGAALMTSHQAAFNIRAVDGSICVSCAVGTVQVAYADRQYPVVQGHQLRIGNDGVAVTRPGDIVSALAWRKGLMIFDGAPLTEVISEMNRYLPGKIILTNRALGTKPVAGVFRISRADFAVTQLQEIVGAHTIRLGNIILLG